jgi:hypothetical protein
MEALVQLLEAFGCSPHQHSWAWIAPEGTFYKVSDHKKWALEYMGPTHFAAVEKERNLTRVVASGIVSKQSYEKLVKKLLATPVEALDEESIEGFSPGEQEVWPILVDAYVETGGVLFQHLLLQKGWMRASNPFHAETHKEATSAQWKSFFQQGISCWHGSFSIAMYVLQGDEFQRLQYVDALYQFLPKKEAEALMELILQK